MRTWTFPERHPTITGPWEVEPDKAQWIDPTTDLDCLAVRNRVGAWCGYVGVPPSHPWHGLGYSQCSLRGRRCREDDDAWCDHTPSALTQVHGGITFSAFCQEGDEEGPGICHVPLDGRPPNVWWFGFDCAHHRDLSPWDVQQALERPDWGVMNKGRSYRTLGYVEAETARLARQLATPQLCE